MKAFSNYHPFVLMTYFLSVIVIAMFVTNPVLQISALLGAILFCTTLTGKRELGSNLGFYIPMFLLVAVTNPLFSHNGITPLFFLNGNPVTLEAFIYGIGIAVMVIAVMLWCKCYSEIMTSDKFLYLFGRIIPKLSLVLSMALRFIPMFKRQMHKVSKAQKSMGLYSSKSFVDKIKEKGAVLTAMVSWSLENAMETSASMRARGYGMKGRTSFSMFRFRKNDALLLSVCAGLLGITLFGIINKSMDFYYYPKITEVNTSPVALGIYIAFATLSFLPFMIEVKEAVTWKYYISKI